MFTATEKDEKVLENGAMFWKIVFWEASQRRVGGCEINTCCSTRWVSVEDYKKSRLNNDG